MILRFGLQTPLCNLCREVYNETKAEGFLAVFAVALLAEGVDRNVKRMTGIDRLEWLNTAQCEKVIEGLKAILAREQRKGAGRDE